MELTRGARLGSYRIVDLLGQGGMGAVYVAEDERLGRTVAIKVLATEIAGAEELARFRRESRAAALVRHANILTVHEASLAGDTPYLVMEVARGGSLSQKIKKEGQLPWREAARVGAQIARALEAVHAAGLVHRDLKPANVLFDESGDVKLSDFGLVRAAPDSIAQSRRLTATGEFVGTLEYTAPEQIDAARDVTASADVFSLGATLFMALAGRPPFDGRGPNLLYNIVSKPPASLRKHAPDVPRALEKLVASLLEKDPAKRLGAGEVADELETLPGLEGRGREAPLLVAGAIGACAVLVALALGSRGAPPTGHGEQPPRPSPSPPPSVPAPIPSPAPPSSSSGTQSEVPESLASSTVVRVEKILGTYAWKDTGNVSAIAFRDDGELVTANYLGNVRTWDRDGHATRHVDLPGGALQAGALAPDGRHVVAGFEKGPLELADLETLSSRTAAGPPFEHVVGLGFVSAKTFVALGADGGVAFGSLEPFHVGPRESAGATALATCPRTGACALGHEGGIIEVRVGERIRSAPGRYAIRALAFSRDGTRLASWGEGTEQRELTLYDATGDAVGMRVLFSRSLDQGDLRTVSIAPLGDRVVVVDAAGRVRIFGRKAADDRDLGFALGHATDVYYTRLAVAPDGKRFAVAGVNAISFWDGHARITPVTGHEGPVLAIGVSEDGRRVLSGGQDGRVLLWDLEQPSAPFAFEGTEDHVTAVAVTRDGRWGLAADHKGRRVHRLDLDPRTASIIPIVSETRALAFAPDGKHFVGGHRDSSAPPGQSCVLEEWPSELGTEETHTLSTEDGEVLSVAWPAKDVALAAMSDSALRVWHPLSPLGDGMSGKSAGRPFTALACTDDASRALTGDTAGVVYLFDLDFSPRHDFKCLPVLVHALEVRGVALLDGGRTVVSASRDWHLAVAAWDDLKRVRTNECMRFVDVGDEVCSLAAGKDAKGELLLVGTYRGAILELRLR